MQYNSEYRGKVYSLLNGDVYELKSNGKYNSASAYINGTVSVALTGYYNTLKSGTPMYQTTGGYFIDMTDGWTYTNTISVPSYSQQQAQALVQKIIKNNKHIIQNNLLCAKFSSKLTSSQRSTLRELQDRLESRNTALKSQGLCNSLTESYPSGYEYLQPYLESVMNGDEGESGVGGVVTTIIVTAIVIAALSTAAYFAYYDLAEESANDVKFSDELTKTLQSKLTDEEYQQLLTETKGIVTKAKIKASLGGSWTVVKYGAIAFAAIYLFSRFKSRSTETQTDEED